MNRRLSVAVCAILVAGGWAGCSDSPARQAGSNLRQKSAEARQGIEKALDLMGNPVVADLGGLPLPSPGPYVSDPNAMTILAPEALNPRALKLLDDVAEPLEQALRDNSQADPADKALALSMAGRVQELRGRFFAWQAAAERRNARDLLAEARGHKASLQVCAGSLQYFQAFLAAGPSEANALVESAQKTATLQAAKVKELDGEIQALQDKAKALRQSYDALSKEASTLRMDSKSATGREALDLVGKSVNKQKLANQAASELARVENAITMKQADRTSPAAEANLALALVAVGTSGVNSREALDANVRLRVDGLAAAIAEVQKKLDERVGQIAEHAKKARDAEEKAVAAMEQAAQKFQAAQSAQAAQASPGAPAGVNDQAKRAEALLAEAGVLRDGLRLHGELAEFAARMKELWPRLGRPNEMPESYAKLAADYLPDPAKAKETALKTCELALDAFRMLPDKVDNNVRWMYQALVGASWLCHYDITQDKQDLTRAQTELAEAVKDKEDSPYLAGVMEMHRQVQRLLQSAPVSVPASAPVP